jgi:hypothetical protein
MEFYNEGKDYRKKEMTQVERWNLATQKQFPDIADMTLNRGTSN